jgi:YfiH family protein
MTLTRSSLLAAIPGIQHAFGDRKEPIPTFCKEDWEQSRPQWKQVHGIEVGTVESPRQDLGEVDAVLTWKNRIPIAVVTADCVPILLAREDGGAVAAVHAGWRGTYARILEALWVRLNQAGEDPTRWVAAIGPAIGPCCYQVSPELAQDFVTRFSSLLPAEQILPRDRMLNLPAVNAAQLRGIGFHRIEILSQCTHCSTEPGTGTPRFESFRRDASKARQYSLIERTVDR